MWVHRRYFVLSLKRKRVLRRGLRRGFSEGAPEGGSQNGPKRGSRKGVLIRGLRSLREGASAPVGGCVALGVPSVEKSRN